MSKSRNSKYYKDMYNYDEDDSSNYKKYKSQLDRRKLKKMKNNLKSKNISSIIEDEDESYA